MHEPVALANIAVLVLTGAVSILAFRRPDLDLREKLIFCPRRILAGKEFYRLLTSSLLHADWRHLLFNAISLYLFGRAIEAQYGPGAFLMIYGGGVLGGSLLSLFLHRHHEYRACGASGGVCGVIFASIFLLPGGSIYMLPLPLPIPAWLYAIAFLGGSFYALKNRNDGIGHDAHLGGAIAGLLTATALHPWIVTASPWLYAAALLLSIILMGWLLMNPLLLPARALVPNVKRPSRRRSPPPPRPKQKQQALETDRILEKISAHGLDSLTKEERRHLLNVSELHRHRAASKKPESDLIL